MRFIFFKNATLKEYIKEEPLVQSSINAYPIKVEIEETNLHDYIATVEFKRPDNQVSGELQLALANNTYVGFVPAWATQIAGQLKITVRLWRYDEEGNKTVKAQTLQNVEVSSATSMTGEAPQLSQEQYDAIMKAIFENTNALGNKADLDPDSRIVVREQLPVTLGKFYEDDTTINIDALLEDNSDYSFTSNLIENVKLKLPPQLKHGYASSVSFKVRDVVPNYILEHPFDKEVISIFNGNRVSEISLTPQSAIIVSIIYDGIYIYQNVKAFDII